MREPTLGLDLVIAGLHRVPRHLEVELLLHHDDPIALLSLFSLFIRISKS